MSVTSFGAKPKIAMLTYNAPDEHNVLQSLLCLEPCRGEECSEHKEVGEVLANSDLMAVKALKLYQSDDTIKALQKIKPDFLSMSGHHSSGFSGSEGSFYFDELTSSIRSSDLSEALLSPKVVLLNGCYTDVSKDFQQDPISYIEHIVTETEVRSDTVERFQSAISQISGFQKEYVNVFPQACIMGYEGTSIPGGIPQIYMQYTNYFRALYKALYKEELPAKIKILSGDYAKKEKKIFNECPNGQWPCNLCEHDSKYYSKFSKALALYLKKEKQRLQQKLSHKEFWGESFEQALQDNRFYKNTGWACRQTGTFTEPVIPRNLNRTKNAKLLFKALFWVKDSQLDEQDRVRLAEEALHGIHYIKFQESDLEELRQFVNYHEQELNSISNLNLKSSSFVQYYELVQRFECESCLSFTESLESLNELRPSAQKAFAKSLSKDSPSKYFKLMFQLEDKNIVEIAARNLHPEAHKPLYKGIFNESESLAEAAARSLSNSQSPPEEVLLEVINSPFQQARVTSAYFIPSTSSEKVMQAILNSPHYEDFKVIWPNHMTQKLLY